MSKLILKNVVIILDGATGTPLSIGASGAKNIKVYHNVGTNFAADVNITNIITGTSIVEATDYE